MRSRDGRGCRDLGYAAWVRTGVTLQQRTGISLNRLGPGIGDDTTGIPHKISHLTGHQNQAPAWKSGQKTVPW